MGPHALKENLYANQNKKFFSLILSLMKLICNLSLLLVLCLKINKTNLVFINM